jgi:hypothetical protein
MNKYGKDVFSSNLNPFVLGMDFIDHLQRDERFAGLTVWSVGQR